MSALAHPIRTSGGARFSYQSARPTAPLPWSVSAARAFPLFSLFSLPFFSRCLSLLLLLLLFSFPPSPLKCPQALLDTQPKVVWISPLPFIHFSFFSLFPSHLSRWPRVRLTRRTRPSSECRYVAVPCCAYAVISNSLARSSRCFPMAISIDIASRIALWCPCFRAFYHKKKKTDKCLHRDSLSTSSVRFIYNQVHTFITISCGLKSVFHDTDETI